MQNPALNLGLFEENQKPTYKEGALLDAYEVYYNEISYINFTGAFADEDREDILLYELKIQQYNGLPDFIKVAESQMHVVMRPFLYDVGTYDLVLSATDGYFTISKNFTLTVRGHPPALQAGRRYEDQRFIIGQYFEILF